MGGKNYFAHGSSPEVGQKQKTEKKERGGAKVGENNGQATHGTRKHVWRTQAAWAKILHISSSYAKIFGKTNFSTLEIPGSGSKAKEIGERRKKEDRKLVITMASYGLHRHGGARKAAWANLQT